MTVDEFLEWAIQTQADSDRDIGNLEIEFRVVGRDAFPIFGAALSEDNGKTRVLLY
jgi:hypothetical protein